MKTLECTYKVSPSEILNKSQKEKRVKILVDSNGKAKIISGNIK